jgi:hypothetical protein
MEREKKREEARHFPVSLTFLMKHDLICQDRLGTHT